MGHYFAKLYKRQETRILMNGLDAAGKTTILYFLKLGEVVTSIPTIGFNVETVRHKNISLTTWDVGGRDKIRPLYRHYYPNTNALMFVIDSSDQDRLEIIADELMKVLSEDELRDTVILILANKQDLESAMSLDEIKKGLDYDKILGNNMKRRINIFGCSAVTKDGQHDLYKALDWLCDELAPPKSSWWFSKSDKSLPDKTSVKTNTNTESNTEKKNEDTTNTDSAHTEKNAWTLGCYMKESLVSVKRVVTSLW